MIFFAGSLQLNGGSTFLVRMARAMAARGERIAVVVINDVRHDGVVEQLQQHADIFYPQDIVSPAFASLAKAQLCTVLPMRKATVRDVIRKYGDSIHVMGMFGLLLAARWTALCPGLKVSAGVYQQHEFAFQSPLRFARRLRAVFGALPAANVVFFNEHNEQAYSAFFGRSYATSRMVPIGVDIPALPDVLAPTQRGRIVSVGNLENFKTYNEHVIRTVHAMREAYPTLRYDIYGEGNERANLEALVASLGLQDRVTLHGRIPYTQFASIVSDAMVFVGSGTALLEAASYGVPAVVGIESMNGPSTYGFLFDVKGFSYNEGTPGAIYTTFEACFRQLLDDSDSGMRETGMRCREKALTFSIDHTVDGFLALKQTAQACDIGIGSLSTLGYAVDFVSLGLAAHFLKDDSFRNRRNQSEGAKTS